MKGERREEAEVRIFSFHSSLFKLHTFLNRSFKFALSIIGLCRKLDEIPGVSRTLSNQLLRSGTSIGANIEEGQASQSRADFLSKYSISCKEARETYYWLKLISASGIIPSDSVKDIMAECNELVAILTTITKKIRKTPE